MTLRCKHAVHVAKSPHGLWTALRQLFNQQPLTCPQSGTLTTKNSPARNLHRLVSAVDFIKVLLQNLSEEPPVTLHTACADAYNKCVALSIRALKCGPT